MLKAVLCAAMLASAPLLGVCDDQADFDELWADTFAHAEQDTKEVALQLWQNMCPDCDHTSPATQQNKSSDPNIVFNFVGPSDSNVFYEIATHYENLMRNYFFSPLLDDFPCDASSTDPAPNSEFATIMRALFPNLQTDYGDNLSDWNEHTGLQGVSGSGGAGVGFGINAFCNKKLLFSYGGGLGAGYDASQQQLVGGGGGGAGFQAFTGGAAPTDDEYPADDDNSGGTPSYQVGGGGGGGVVCTSSGCTSPTWGTSSDPNEQTPAGVWKAIAAEATACYKAGGLILTGAGGAGGGWSAVDSSGALVGNYGGGVGFSFELASPTGGVTPPSSRNQGVQIGRAVTSCIAQCTAASSSAGQGFYTCLCPCQKNAFLSLGLPWANTISCNVPSPSQQLRGRSQ